MPLIPSQMQSAIQLKATSDLMSGNKMPDIVSAISFATCQYITASAIINSVNVVLGPGAGTQTGVITGLVPQGMSSLMLSQAISVGLSGQNLPALFDAVSYGVSITVMASPVQGTVIGGGPGAGTGTIIGLVPTALQALILNQAIFRLLSGTKLRDIVYVIAFGICTYIMTAGVVTLTDIGTFTPPPVGPVPIPAAPGIGSFV